MTKSWACCTYCGTAYVLRHTAYMPYFNYTRLNLYLDLLSDIGFQHCIALWKAYNKRKLIVQFLHAFKGICTILVFLEYIFRFCIFDFVKNWSRGSWVMIGLINKQRLRLYMKEYKIVSFKFREEKYIECLKKLSI